MVKILLNLEPLQIASETIILEELDECRQVIFLENSEFMVGYSINKVPIYKVTQMNVDIGSYSVTFNVRSHFIFKTINQSKGYFIRKGNWIKIMDDEQFKQLVKLIKGVIKRNYEKNLVEKLLVFKLQEVQ